MTENLIDNPEAALFFVHLTKAKHLRPFLSREASLSEAATFLNISKTRMSYWLKKLLELNLITVVRIEKRGKHNVPIYRSTADVFIVPLELLPIESDEAILDAHLAEFEKTSRRSLIHTARKNAEGWHIRYSLFREKARLDIVPNSAELEDAKIVNHFGRLKLSENHAATLRREMMTLLERYLKVSSDKEKSFLFKLLLVEERLE
jgi:DNA-binding transcriptional ArsR family regulator